MVWVRLRRYCLKSTIEGLKYFYLYTDILSRCFWALNMITLTMLTFAITWLLYKRFDEMPTRVTIENQFEPLLKLPYPTITLCSPNQLTLSSLEYFNQSLIDAKPTVDLKSILPLLLGFYELIDDLNPDVLQQLQNSFDQNRFTIPEVLGKIPLSCERFLKRCFFEGKYNDCRNFFKPVLTVHGYCCSFNSKYYFTGKRAAVDHNFNGRQILVTGLKSFFTVICDYEPGDAFAGTILNAGSIRVMLTDSTEFPADYESYLVDTNAETFLFLSAIYTYCSEDVQLLPWWSRECYFEDERKVAFFNHYHDSDCDLICYATAVWTSCNCWLSFLPVMAVDKICKATHIPCITNVKKNMNAWLSTEQCHCPRNCVSRKYRADLTVGNLRGIPYMIGPRSRFAGLKFNESTSILNFLFTQPTYAKLKQETVSSVIGLISEIGGVFGIFMGCSTLSIFEIFFYVYKRMRNYRR